MSQRRQDSANQSSTLQNRRQFLKFTALAGTGLILSAYLPSGAAAAPPPTIMETTGAIEAAPAAGVFEPNAFIRIGSDNRITIWVAKCEMGQGARTALPMLVAEELEVELASVQIEQAIADPRYGDMDTEGSQNIARSWLPMRKVGAQAREMLLTAAAQLWQVDRASCRAERGLIIHQASGRQCRYGELVELAAKLPVPADAPLKDPRNFRLIGQRHNRLDENKIITGQAVYGLDARLPGLLYAVVARCPVFGGKVASFDASAAKAIKGVRQVVEIESGIAVVAENSWLAMQGRNALKIKWAEGVNADLSSTKLKQLCYERAQQPAKLVRSEGNVVEAFKTAVKRIEAVYEIPYVSHATMEPPNATVDVRPDGCDVWLATQFPNVARAEVARVTGLPVEKVKINTTLLGTGFGRRGLFDFVVETAQISKAVGAPIKTLWTREDDLQHDSYRLGNVHFLSAGLNAAGLPIAWTHRIAGPSLAVHDDANTTRPEQREMWGAADIPYEVPNLLVDYAQVMSEPLPLGYLRSVSRNPNLFVTETFIDELAAAANEDPYLYRLKLIGKGNQFRISDTEDALLDTARLKGVLTMVAAKANWGKPLPTGWARGIACHNYQTANSYVAQVAEISLNADQTIKVHRVVCVIDCGQVVNPDMVEAQMEGGIIFGLGLALNLEITFDKGRVQQTNFDNYPPPRMKDSPKLEVYIMPSKEAPGGAGEIGVPTVAPAVANALFALTGKRVRAMPFGNALKKS